MPDRQDGVADFDCPAGAVASSDQPTNISTARRGFGLEAVEPTAARSSISILL